MPTEANPNSSQYRCDSCGRTFNSAEELTRHRPQCTGAKATGAGSTRTEEGKRNEEEDREWVSMP